MRSAARALTLGLPACAPLAALVVGIVAMRQLGVSTRLWSINVAAAALGLLIWFAGNRLSPPARRVTLAILAAAGVALLLAPFASEGVLGVHRWIPVAGLRLHASAIVAPLLVFCVAAAASRSVVAAAALGVTGTVIMALQPDAAQATSFAAACAVVLVRARTERRRTALIGLVLLVAASAASFVRRDPLPPVPHVEGIFAAVASNGTGPAAVATLALLLLPVPFFAAWHRYRRTAALAVGVYIALTLVAPAWGTFPVPVMGFGASPILGYFIALVAGVGGPSRIEEAEGKNGAEARPHQLHTRAL